MCRVSVKWEDQPDSPRTEGGMLEDISASGAGISINKPIPAGTKLKIQGIRRELVGTVQNCRREGSTYFLGIRFDEPDEEWASFGAGL